MPFSPEVYVGDSSTHGYALLSTQATFAECHRGTSFHERWRFKEVSLPPTRPHLAADAVASLGALLPLGGGAQPVLPHEVPLGGFFADTSFRGRAASFKPAALSTTLAAEIENAYSVPRSHRRLVPSARSTTVGVPGGVPALPDSWCRRERWSTIIEAP